jgi:hypothetical protein
MEIQWKQKKAVFFRLPRSWLSMWPSLQEGILPCTGDTSRSKEQYFTSLSGKTNLDRKNRTDRKLTCESGSSCQLPHCILILLRPFRAQKYLRKRNFTLAKVMTVHFFWLELTEENSQNTWAWSIIRNIRSIYKEGWLKTPSGRYLLVVPVLNWLSTTPWRRQGGECMDPRFLDLDTSGQFHDRPALSPLLPIG